MASKRKRRPAPTRDGRVNSCRSGSADPQRRALVGVEVGPRFRGGGKPGWKRAALGALAATAFLAAKPSHAQTQQDADRFIQLLQSYDYEKLIGGKVLETDQQMAPPCQGERKIESRQLVTVTEAPQFISTREVPIAGRWLERVTVSRCGKSVRHNVFLQATRVRGLHAVVGFPGESRADLDLQFQIGKQVVANARRTNAGCKRLDIIDIATRDRNVSPGQPWTEIWTSWVCGTLVTSEVRYAPKPGGGIDFRVR
ncbi:MAG TPA: hypothetical protein VNJ05_06395 [Sphingomicrobium sp.]|nr:hypothetical protein [Sphingomicrobium sp.]